MQVKLSRDDRARQLSRLPKDQLVTIYTSLPGYLGDYVRNWTKGELMESILTVEYPGQ